MKRLMNLFITILYSVQMVGAAQHSIKLVNLDWLSIDKFEYHNAGAWITVEADNPSIKYIGANWERGECPTSRTGWEDSLESGISYAEFTFQGDGIRVFTGRRQYQLADIYLDGNYKGRFSPPEDYCNHLLFEDSLQFAPITPIFEGTINNCNGEFTAVFGYNNPNPTEVTISVGSSNSFGGSSQDKGQPTTFSSGRQKDVFRVNFSTGSLVWTLQNTTATATSSNPINVCRQRIQPLMNGVVKNSSGSYTAYFGYINHNDVSVSIPIGASNNLSNGATSQPTSYAAGEYPASFSVTFSGSTVTWTIDGSSVTAFADYAYFMRLPQSIVNADIPSSGLSLTAEDAVDMLSQMLPDGISEAALQEIAERVMARYPDFEAMITTDNISVSSEKFVGEFRQRKFTELMI